MDKVPPHSSQLPATVSIPTYDRSSEDRETVPNRQRDLVVWIWTF